MTQEELAAALGKTRSLVSFLERTGNINKYTLKEIADILQVKPEDLDSGEDLNPEEYTREDEQPEYKTPQVFEKLVEQQQEEIKFLKETINHQWELLKELSKGR